MSASADVNLTFEDQLTVGVGLPNPVTVAIDPLSVGISNLPKVTIGIDPLSVDPLKVGITELPKVEVGITELPTISIAPLTIEPLTVTLTPIDLSLGITSFPSLRVHIPAHFRVGFKVFGKELFSAGLHGEAQVITEPYTPAPCERCGTGP